MYNVQCIQNKIQGVLKEKYSKFSVVLFRKNHLNSESLFNMRENKNFLSKISELLF